MNALSCGRERLLWQHSALPQAAWARQRPARRAARTLPPCATEPCATDAGPDAPAPVTTAPPPPAAPAPAPSTDADASSSAAADAALPIAFRALAGVSVAFGASALLAPELLLQLVNGGAAATPLEAAFTRIAGGTMTISAAVEWSLADAAANGRLGSPTYQRLLAAVAAKNITYLTAFAMATDAWTPALLLLYPTAPLLSLDACFLGLSKAGATAQSLADGVVSIPKTAAGWIYTVFALLYAATFAACWAPEVMFLAPLTPLALLLKHTWAPGFLLAGGACLVLKDAADRGRLGASTFKRLNLGLAAVEFVYTAVFGASVASGLASGDPSATSNIVGSIGIASYCLFQYATAKKK